MPLRSWAAQNVAFKEATFRSNQKFWKDTPQNDVQVLILENASAGALKGWSCEKLAQEFPEAKMRREQLDSSSSLCFCFVVSVSVSMFSSSIPVLFLVSYW